MAQCLMEGAEDPALPAHARMLELIAAMVLAKPLLLSSSHPPGNPSEARVDHLYASWELGTASCCRAALHASALQLSICCQERRGWQPTVQ